jgi:polyisoprenoid-binding protein YceI
VKNFVGFLLLLVTSIGRAQDLVPDTQNSHVAFEIKNFGLTVVGTVSGLSGIIKFDPDELENALVNLSVQVATLETGISLRNKHLKKKEFFDVEKHPELRISSISITKSNSDSYFFTGNLSIKGITKEVSFPFTISPSENGFNFDGMFTMNRLDFDIGTNSLSMGDNVLVKFQIRAARRLP